jgi:hypothetical protein
MKSSVAAFTLLLALHASALLSAKGTTTRITISGGDLSTPIEIGQREVVERFNIWAGPGTRMRVRDAATGEWRSSEGAEGFIVDWPAGAIAHMPSGLEQYEVSFFVRYRNESAERLAYVVLYKYDASNDQGYVYLPGSADERYRLNTRAIFRGVEGKWFRASPAWQRVVTPLIASMRAQNQ